MVTVMMGRGLGAGETTVMGGRALMALMVKTLPEALVMVTSAGLDSGTARPLRERKAVEVVGWEGVVEAVMVEMGTRLEVTGVELLSLFC